MATIRLAINGKPYTVDTDPQTSLLSVLREQLDLTGSKYGCGEGQCGACTVLIDGKAQRSCVTKVGTVAQKQITTIEGLASGEQLHPVQEAFLDAGAMQCGYCTSGMIMSAVALLKRNPAPRESEIVDFMDGNICRCGTYPRIVAAIQKAAGGRGRERGNERDERQAQVPLEPERYELTAAAPYRFDLDRREFFKFLGAGVLVVSVLTPAVAAQESGGARQRRGDSLPKEIDAWLHIGENGKVTVYTGKVEMGQNIRTSLSQAVAEELHVPIEKIEMVMGDTQLTPFDMGTFGSRTTPTMNLQLRKVAAAACDVLIGLAAAQWKVDRQRLVAADGKVTDPQTKRSLEYAAADQGHAAYGEPSGGRSFDPRDASGKWWDSPRRRWMDATL